MSALKTAVLLGALTGLLVGLGYIIGGSGLAILALILAGAMNFFAYWFSDKLALRMAGAREVTQQQEPGLHAIVAEVATLAGVPKPRVYVVENESPNAFATGRNPQHAVVAVTTGIRRILTDRELRAVIAHEMGHVKNRDILISSVAATVAGAISYIQTMLLWGSLFGGGFGGRGRNNDNVLIAFLASIVAAFAAMMLQLAISRTREFQADASGAEYVHDPEALASALSKLQTGVQMRPMQQNAGTQATSSLYIMHPFRMEGGFSNLFSTHPPVEERIRRLRKMAGYVDVQ
ncbi:MAG TPA: zinc metalloprotease HtpX [Dehalococcoidia bacterium]|nr:zinc metalloprotease HtpX [Dehalococcoidia bacterium]